MSSPKAFIVMPYKEPYQKLYTEVILAALANLGFAATRADEIPRSSPFTDDIEAAVRSADLIIVEASEPNKNVYYELGLARAWQREIILLAKSAGDLPSDTRNIRHLVYDPNHLELLKETFEQWLRSTRAYQLNQQINISKTLNRGEVFADICDATIYLEREILDPRKEIVKSIHAGRLIDPKYIYMFDRGTQYWLDLCADAEYLYFRNSIVFLRANLGEMLDAIDVDVIGVAPDIVSLGPGNGLKDRIILSAILQRQSAVRNEAFYYPFDISANMITSAIRNIYTQSDIASRLHVKAAVMDFGSNLRSFSPVYQFRAEPNVFLLLGNTLGNFKDETIILQQIKRAMFQDDYLLLEVKTRRSEKLDLGGSEALYRLLDFTPLDALGVQFQQQKFKYDILSNVSTIEGTSTIVATYTDFIAPINYERYDTVYLSYVHEYVPSSLRKVIERLKFRILGQFDGDGFVYFLLRNSG
jgi:hypothetical protein